MKDGRQIHHSGAEIEGRSRQVIADKGLHIPSTICGQLFPSDEQNNLLQCMISKRELNEKGNRLGFLKEGRVCQCRRIGTDGYLFIFIRVLLLLRVGVDAS